MADESELSRFREQWREEVTARTQGRGRAASTSSSSAACPSAQKPRPPSFSHTRPARVIVDEDGDIIDELPRRPAAAATAISPSPLPARRPSFSVTGIPNSALEHYEKAVQKEGEGNLGESVRLYRKAFRMDDAVDQAYGEKHFPRRDKGKVVIAATAAADATPPSLVEAAAVTASTAGVSELVASFAELVIEPTSEPALDDVEEKKKFCLLAKIPSEILLQILCNLALADIAAFVRLTQVCKRLCYVVTSESQIWRDICAATYLKQVWDWKVTAGGHPIIDEDPSQDLDDEEEDEEKRVTPIDEDQLPHYSSSWREMFHLRPRVRYNGIYISTCHYHRSGGHSGTSLSWGTPVHIVTYYRYLRFYPDGTVLSLLTTHEPSDVVYTFSKPSLTPARLGGQPGGVLASWAAHVCRGRWRVSVDGRVDIEMEVPHLPRYLFRMQLGVKSVRAGRHSVRGGVRLVWEGFWSWNKLTNDTAVFERRNDKPFFFSRVGAVERELGIV